MIIKKIKEDLVTIIVAGAIGGLIGRSLAPVVFPLFQNPSKVNQVQIRDLNNDSREDIILETKGGERVIYLQRPDGKYVSLDSYIQTRRDSALEQLIAYKDSIELRAKDN